MLLKHPNTTVTWAHAGLGRIVRPVKDQLGILDRALANPELKHLHIDISWDETAKYIAANPETVTATANLIEKYADRFLFGSDVVAPKSIDVTSVVTAGGALSAPAGVGPGSSGAFDPGSVVTPPGALP